jgi:hypothetical protein
VKPPSPFGALGPTFPLVISLPRFFINICCCGSLDSFYRLFLIGSFFFLHLLLFINNLKSFECSSLLWLDPLSNLPKSHCLCLIISSFVKQVATWTIDCFHTCQSILPRFPCIESHFFYILHVGIFS